MIHLLFSPTGEAKFKIAGKVGIKYKGHVNVHGAAFGHGVAINRKNPGMKFKGTFMNNKFHGIGEKNKII